MDKSTHEEHLFQPLQTNNKQYELAITFLTGYNGIFNVTNSNNKFFFKKALIGEDFIQITISAGAYEIESLVDENQRIIIDQGHYTEANYPIRIKPNFSTLDTNVEILPQGPIIGFAYDDIIGKLLGFNEIPYFMIYDVELENTLKNITANTGFFKSHHDPQRG